MNNHSTEDSQVLDAFIIDLICNSKTQKYETTSGIFHITEKNQQLLNNDSTEISEIFFILAKCYEHLHMIDEVEESNNLKVWLLQSEKHENKTTIKAGHIVQRLLEYQISNFSLTIEKLTLFIIPFSYTENVNFFVFHPSEYEMLINLLDKQSPYATMRFTKN